MGGCFWLAAVRHIATQPKKLRRMAMAGRWLMRISLIWLACLWGTGCGYHFAGEGSGPKPGLQKIAIPVFENKTSEAELETLFAGALRHQFLVRGPFQVVSSNEAEAVFRGRIIRIETM